MFAVGVLVGILGAVAAFYVTSTRGHRDDLPPEAWSVRPQGRPTPERPDTGATGSAEPWPDDVDPALRPERFVPALARALRAGGGELIGVDCDAYPCVVAMWIPTGYAPISDNFETQGLELVRAVVDNAGYADHDLGWTRVSGDPTGFLCATALKASRRPLEFGVGERGEALYAEAKAGR